MSRQKVKMARLLERARRMRPNTPSELAAYVRTFMGLKIPSQRICPGHDSPLDYLSFLFFGVGVGERNSARSGRDCAVWANRGGGKTQLGAVATLLECIFLEGCQGRILCGSQEQSGRMYEYLRRILDGGFSGRLDGRITVRGCQFAGGGAVGVLAQSDRSVRGHHVQRLRCDEVELFDRDIWQAAQFVTQSVAGIPAQLEAFSTMHKPYGLMHEIISSAYEDDMRVFRWCLWEVIERCRDRNCSGCPLWEDCCGKAKQADGYYSIDDAIAQKRRSSEQSWKSEMLCLQPNREDLVFPEFNPHRHVHEISYDGNLPLYRTIDFGFTNPLACLFIQVDQDDRVFVIGEHIKSRTTLSEQARLIKERYPYPVEATYCDPAGRGRNEITGTNLIQEMVALGIPLRCRNSRILDGVELIRDFLSPAYGPSRLHVSNKCEDLIRAFGGLHHRRLPNGTLSELPEKDGVHDHVIDALRYFFVNRFARSYPLQEKRY